MRTEAEVRRELSTMELLRATEGMSEAALRSVDDTIATLKWVLS